MSEFKALPQAGTFAAWDWNGERYCIDCINDIVDDEDERELLFENPDRHPSGGPVRSGATVNTQYHCGRGEDCLNATTEHQYPHDNPVGKPLNMRVLDRNEQWDGRDPEIHVENDDGMVFTVSSPNFKFKVEWERDADNIALVERTNKGTLETERNRRLPDGIYEYAREIVEEGKQARA